MDVEDEDVLFQRTHGFAREALDRSVAIAIHAAGRPDPDATLAILPQHRFPVRRQPGVVRDLIAADAIQALVVDPDPEGALSVKQEGHHMAADRLFRHGDKPVPLQAKYAVVRADPDLTARIHVEDPRTAIGQPMRLAKVGELALAQAHQVVLLGTHPKAAVGALLEFHDAVAGEPVRVSGVEDREANAVEADQPVPGGEPEIAIAPLQYTPDRVHRQPVLCRPDLVDERCLRRVLRSAHTLDRGNGGRDASEGGSEQD